MAIDDLLYQSDPAQRRLRAAQAAPQRPPAGGDPVARAAINRARIPTVPAPAAAPAAPAIDVLPQTAPAAAAAPAAKGALSRFGRAAGRVAGPAAVVGVEALDASQTFRDPNATGLDKSAAVAKGVGRGAATLAGGAKGAALGSAFGPVGTLAGGALGSIGGYLLADKAIDIGRNLASVDSSAPKAAAPAAVKSEAIAPVQPQTEPQAVTPTSGRIYRDGNSFSDQPIGGSVEFKPQAGGFAAALPNANAPKPKTGIENIREYLASREADTNEALARRNASIDSTVANADRFAAQEKLDQAARSAKIDAGSLVNADLPPRARAALLERAGQAEQSAAASRALPRPGSRTPEQEAELSAGKAKTKADLAGAETRRNLEDQQGIAAGITNQQALQQQQVLAQLASLPEGAKPGQRRALVDRALVGAGKDPDAGRFIGIDSLAPDGFTTLKSALDTRTGQIVGAGGAVGGAGGKPQYSEGQMYRSNGQLFRIENGKPVPVQPPK